MSLHPADHRMDVRLETSSCRHVRMASVLCCTSVEGEGQGQVGDLDSKECAWKGGRVVSPESRVCTLLPSSQELCCIHFQLYSERLQNARVSVLYGRGSARSLGTQGCQDVQSWLRLCKRAFQSQPQRKERCAPNTGVVHTSILSEAQETPFLPANSAEMLNTEEDEESKFSQVGVTSDSQTGL